MRNEGRNEGQNEGHVECQNEMHNWRQNGGLNEGWNEGQTMNNFLWKLTEFAMSMGNYSALDQQIALPPGTIRVFPSSNHHMESETKTKATFGLFLLSTDHPSSSLRMMMRSWRR